MILCEVLVATRVIDSSYFFFAMFIANRIWFYFSSSEFSVERGHSTEDESEMDFRDRPLMLLMASKLGGQTLRALLESFLIMVMYSAKLSTCGRFISTCLLNGAHAYVHVYNATFAHEFTLMISTLRLSIR
jgi:hypothetical protein